MHQQQSDNKGQVDEQVALETLSQPCIPIAGKIRLKSDVLMHVGSGTSDSPLDVDGSIVWPAPPVTECWYVESHRALPIQCSSLSPVPKETRRKADPDDEYPPGMLWGD
jgi:hypothetical protein